MDATQARRVPKETLPGGPAKTVPESFYVMIPTSCWQEWVNRRDEGVAGLFFRIVFRGWFVKKFRVCRETL